MKKCHRHTVPFLSLLARRFKAGESPNVHCELRSKSMFVILIFSCFELGDKGELGPWMGRGGDTDAMQVETPSPDLVSEEEEGGGRGGVEFSNSALVDVLSKEG